MQDRGNGNMSAARPLRTETFGNMVIEWDVPITMSDGLVLRGDVFRPIAAGSFPVLLSYGPYGKWLAFQDGYKSAWEYMVRFHPDSAAGSSNRFHNWEVADPEKWVPDGYVCVRVDSRGAGRSPGYLDLNSSREIDDLCECIEWAGTQIWSNGKVGLSGISYYAANQWRAAARRPKHLAAICVWEGFVDGYRDATRHGGILCTFAKNWNDMQIKTVQHGLGANGPVSRMTGEFVCGPKTLSEEKLVANRSDQWKALQAHPLDDQRHQRNMPDLAMIEVPLLSAGNWGGQGLHLRGNIEGFLNAGSSQKWLEIHGGPHWVEYYTDYGLKLQKQFFGHFLKGEANGWDRQPKVQLKVRNPGERFVIRHESQWPLAHTRWTKFYLDPKTLSLELEPATGTQKLEYAAMGEGLTFSTAPLQEQMEITGPCAAKLFLSSSTSDADVFLILRLFAPDDSEVHFFGALDPKTPIAQGWLRASHRKLDSRRSTPYRPYHAHDEKWPLSPHKAVELNVEIWPTSIVIPKGYRLAVTILGRDYEHDAAAAALSNIRNPMKGCGPFVHDDELDRPSAVFGDQYALHFNRDEQPYVLLPVIR